MLTTVKLSKGILDVVRLLLLQWMISNVLDQFSNGENYIAMIISASGFILSYLLECVLNFLDMRITMKCEWKLTENLNNDLYLRLSKLSYSNFENEEVYNTISKMDEDVAVKVKDSFVTLINSISLFVTVIGVSVIFIQVSTILTGSLFIVIIAGMFFSFKGMDILNNIKYKQSHNQRVLDYYFNLLTEKYSLLELIVFKAKKFILKCRANEEKKIVRELFKKTIVAGMIYNLSTVIIVTWLVISLIYSSICLFNGEINIALFVVVVQSSITLLENIENLVYQLADVSRSMEVFKYYQKFISLSNKKENLYQSNDASLPPLGKNIIKFDHVSFAYPGADRNAITDISFEIQKDRKYAIVGENGAGKSTIVKLIFGLYQPQNGNVLVSREKIGVVYQDYMKYEMSIRENMALGNLDLLNNEKRIRQIIEENGGTDILQQVHSIDQKLGRVYSDSVDLSEGQWQRLAIARGIGSSKDFIIFDEPTASMDPIAESHMYETFYLKDNNRGSLTISHRMASAKQADHIFVLKDGKLYEQGSHDELMSFDSYYKELFEKQAGWYQ